MLFLFLAGGLFTLALAHIMKMGFQIAFEPHQVEVFKHKRYIESEAQKKAVHFN